MIQVDGIFVQQGGGGPVIPNFSYTGEYQLVNEADGNWKLYLITSGIFTPNVDMLVDVCAIGGGQGGNNGPKTSTSLVELGGDAGNPGNTLTTKNIVLQKNVEYTVEIGSAGLRSGGAGGTTVFNTIQAAGGSSSNVPVTIPTFEFNEEGNPTQAAKGGRGGGAAAFGPYNPAENGQDAGSENYPEPGGAAGSGMGVAGGNGSRGAEGGQVGSSLFCGPGGGGGGGFGASGGGGGGVYSNGSPGIGGAGASGVLIVRNAREVAA